MVVPDMETSNCVERRKKRKEKEKLLRIDPSLTTQVRVSTNLGRQ
jgi:hypothetical protein